VTWPPSPKPSHLSSASTARAFRTTYASDFLNCQKDAKTSLTCDVPRAHYSFIDYNDGVVSEVHIIGIKGLERNLLLVIVQKHRHVAAETTAQTDDCEPALEPFRA
jgi:hypothetical protein